MLTELHEDKTTPLVEPTERPFPDTETPAPISRATLARVAGVLYLVVAVLGGFSQLYVRSSVVLPGDATATAQNIRSAATLFRLGFVADLVSITAFLLVALVLYVLFEPVSRRLALAMVVFNAVSVAILSVNHINHAGALFAATSAGYTTVAGTSDSAAQVMLFLDLHSQGYLIAEVFFGLWLLPLGYLAFKSGYFPRSLGVLLMVGAASYLVDVTATLLVPGAGKEVSLILATPAAIAEVAFLLWLVAKGAKTPEKRALNPA